MATIPDIVRTLHHLFTDQADELARFHRFVRRRDKPLTGALFVQTLVLTLLGNPQPALSAYSQTAAARGLSITPTGFDDNFTASAAELLRSILQLAAAVAIAAADPVAANLLTRFSAVLLFDSSCIALPARLATLWMGCAAASAPDAANAATLKLALGLELLCGQLVGCALLDGAVHDQLSRAPRAPLPPRALRFGDLGFFNLARVAAGAAADEFWFSRWGTGTRLVTADGVPWELDALLAAQAGNQYDAWVEVGRERVPARLIAVRMSQDVADNRRRRLRAEARAQGRAVSAPRLAAAGWNVYICNIPVEQLSVEEAVVLAGVRWQIELLFKLWKSHGQIDKWADSANDWRVLCAVDGKLLAMVVSHWVVVVSCWANAARSLGAAARVVRQYAAALVSSWGDAAQMVRTVELMQRVIARTSQMGKRKKHPNTYQLIEHPDLVRITGGLA